MSTLKVNEVTNLGGGVPEGVGGFTASTTITATDSSFAVPALGSPIVKVTAIGGGGGGGGAFNTVNNGGTGGITTFNAGVAGTVTATGGLGGRHANQNVDGLGGTAGFSAGNAGQGGVWANNSQTGTNGNGGFVTVAYLDLSGISTVNVTIGAGGSVGTGQRFGGLGGRGEVILEFVAG